MAKVLIIFWMCVPVISPSPSHLVTSLLVPRTLEMPLPQHEQKLGRNAWRGRYVIFACWPCIYFAPFSRMFLDIRAVLPAFNCSSFS